MSFHKSIWSIVVVGLCAFGQMANCQDVVTESDEINLPLECTGVKASFMLTAPTGDPSFKQISEMPYISKKSNEAVYPGKTNPQLRIEVCQKLGLETFDLQRVVVTPQYEGTLPGIYLADKKQIAKNSGLQQALFGDVSKLELLLVDENEDLANPQSALLVKGMPNGLVGSVKLYKKDAHTWTPSELAVLVGTLGAGDPFSNLKCPVSQQVLKTKTVMGTATFEIEGCGYMGGGETTGYDITAISVTDSNPKLAKEFQGKTYSFEGEALKAALNYKWNHHNGCDSFALKIAESKTIYGATTAGAAGCGVAVEGAPKRTFNDKDYFVKYLLNYNGQIVNGMTKHPHYMWTFGDQLQ